MKALLMVTMLATTNPALAETRMTGAQLDALMTGNTVYLTEPNSGGEIVLWYGADGKAMARLPSKSMLDGTWSIKGDSSCIVWRYSPKDSCSKLIKRADEMVLLEADTNRLLGTVTRIVPTNVENL